MTQGYKVHFQSLSTMTPGLFVICLLTYLVSFMFSGKGISFCFRKLILIPSKHVGCWYHPKTDDHAVSTSISAISQPFKIENLDVLTIKYGFESNKLYTELATLIQKRILHNTINRVIKKPPQIKSIKYFQSEDLKNTYKSCHLL